MCLAKENASGRGKPLLIIICESMSSLASLNRVSFLHYGKCSCNILMKVTAKYINNIDFDRREKGRGRHTERMMKTTLSLLDPYWNGEHEDRTWKTFILVLYKWNFEIKGMMIQETQWIWSQKWLELETWSLTDYSSAQVVTDKASGFPAGTSGKEAACQCRRLKRCRFDPWVGKIPWKHEWQPTPVFLSGESHRQRSLVGYSPWGLKELDMTEAT